MSWVVEISVEKKRLDEVSVGLRRRSPPSKDDAHTTIEHVCTLEEGLDSEWEPAPDADACICCSLSMMTRIHITMTCEMIVDPDQNLSRIDACT